jgi:hypothetical protein
MYEAIEHVIMNHTMHCVREDKFNNELTQTLVQSTMTSTLKAFIRMESSMTSPKTGRRSQALHKISQTWVSN